MIQRSEYLTKIKPFIGKDLVKVLTGIRRSGKSMLLELIRDDIRKSGVSEAQLKVINFEDLDVAKLTINEIYEELKGFCDSQADQCYLFLDEIQELEGWEKLVNSLRVSTKCDIYITGSNSKLLSGELATHLAGRYVEFTIYPLSFAEILRWREQNGEEVNRDDLFREYVSYGGMPFLHANNLDQNSRLTYLQDIYQSVMLKDVVSRHSIRDVDLLSRVYGYIFANIAEPFSVSSLVKYLKNEKRSASQVTIYNYIRLAQDACLFYLVPRVDIQGKKLLSFQEKIYVADLGIREAIYGNNQRDIGQSLENIIYQELIRRGNKVFVGKLAEKEVDFVAEKDGNRHYFQVSYLLANKKVVDREFSAFEGIGDNFPKTVLSLDRFDLSRDGINHQNIIDFLLG